MVREHQGCFKCGLPFKKINGIRHRCYWGMYKIDTKCTTEGCRYAAALCITHEDRHNYSPNLLNWLRWKGVETNTSVASSANRGMGNAETSRAVKDAPKSSHHHSRTAAFDFRPSNRTPKESNRDKVKIQEEKLLKTRVTQPRAPKSIYEGRRVCFAPIIEE